MFFLYVCVCVFNRFLLMQPEVVEKKNQVSGRSFSQDEWIGSDSNALSHVDSLQLPLTCNVTLVFEDD